LTTGLTGICVGAVGFAGVVLPDDANCSFPPASLLPTEPAVNNSLQQILGGKMSQI
jgi:hypothetical protein